MTTATKCQTTAYAERVVSGEIVAGRLVKLAAERHLRDLKRTDIRFDQEAADRAITFFSYLTLSGGDAAGKPFTLEPWEAFIVGSLFGWKLPDGTRRFRVGYVEIGKGNGKSPLAAGIGLYMLVADGKNRAEVYSAAVDKDQAMILFRDGVQMVKASPTLYERLDMSGGEGKEWNIAYLETASFFRPISSEHAGGRGKSGFRVHCGLLDEVHEHPTSAMVDFMRANAKQENALLFEITNSGHDRRTVCYQHHELSVRVLEGVIDNDAWFAYVCSLDPCEACRQEGRSSPKDGCAECDDWRDEEMWIKANPNLGVSISHRYLRELVAEAVAMPTKRNIVQRLNFCIWTSTENRWISDEMWARGDGVIDMASLRKQDCAVGLVVSSTVDISAMVLWFPGAKIAVPYFWVPEDRIAERAQTQQVPYDEWVRDGYITATQGNVIDFATIRATLNQLFEEYAIREVVTKRWNAVQLQTQLMEDGFDVVQAGDGYKDMSAGCKELERLLLEGALCHGGHPVLRWMASNVAIRSDPEGNVRPDKEHSADRIDGIEALVIAIGRGVSQIEGETGVLIL